MLSIHFSFLGTKEVRSIKSTSTTLVVVYCGHQAAAGELQGRAPEPYRDHRRRQLHPQGLRGRRGAVDGVGLRLRREGKTLRGRAPPDDEVKLRHLLRELHPGRHETR